MKRYELMGIDPTTPEGIIKIQNLNCYSIDDEYSNFLIEHETCNVIMERFPCNECIVHRLFEEVEKEG